MIWRLFLFAICLSHLPSSYSQSNNQKSDAEILASARAFYSAIELYSGKKGKEDKNLYGLILKYKDGDDAVFHANDLFGTRPRNQNFDNWMSYLDNISDDYENDIDVTYNNIQLLACFETRYGFNCAIVSVQKSLTYKENHKTELEFIFINLSNLKISEVVFPDYYAAKGGRCSSPDELHSKKKQIEIKRQADFYFDQKKYFKAKELYTSLKEEFNDIAAISRINECNQFLSFENYLKEADNAFANKKFDAAKSLYLKIFEEFPQIDKLLIAEKIKQCDQEISEQIYRRNIEYGDYYFQKGIYNQARYFYQLALQSKPGDIYATNKYKEAKKDDPGIALQAIKRAISLAEADRKNWGIAFRIMWEYEQSGLLNAENYYFMVMLLDGRDKYVKKEMGFKFRDFQNYLNIYAVKLGDISTKEGFEKGIKFLNYNLNKRYQN